MALEDMNYAQLKETAVRYGIELPPNPQKKLVLKSLREYALKMDMEAAEQVKVVQDKLDELKAEVQESHSPTKAIMPPPPTNKNAAPPPRGRGRNFVRCVYCGHTHVPTQFKHCDSCGQRLPAN